MKRDANITCRTIAESLGVTPARVRTLIDEMSKKQGEPKLGELAGNTRIFSLSERLEIRRYHRDQVRDYNNTSGT